MTRFSLLALACVSLTAVACGADVRETSGQEATGREEVQQTPSSGREEVEQTSSSDECPPYCGPWTASPEADWVQQVAERAGYRITGETGSALIARGNGWSFFIWATEGTPKEIREVARRERWQTFGAVEGVEVYGDVSVWRWWVGDGFVLWLKAGPYGDSQLPPLAEMESLVGASKTVPRPRE